MAIRFQAHVHYNPGSGMAEWAEAQMQVRLGQAFHLREGTPEEERSHVTTDIVASGRPDQRRENLVIDVFWPDDNEALAADTAATLFAASVTAHVRPDDPPDRISWARWHRCRHDLAPPTPCTDVEWAWP